MVTAVSFWWIVEEHLVLDVTEMNVISLLELLCKKDWIYLPWIRLLSRTHYILRRLVLIQINFGNAYLILLLISSLVFNCIALVLIFYRVLLNLIKIEVFFKWRSIHGHWSVLIEISLIVKTLRVIVYQSLIFLSHRFLNSTFGTVIYLPIAEQDADVGGSYTIVVFFVPLDQEIDISRISFVTCSFLGGFWSWAWFQS